MSADDLKHIYNLLQNRYPLTFTNTLAVDDGFTEDMPIIVGRNAAASFWLYEYDGEFVFSTEAPGQSCHNHWHPPSIEAAVQDVADFMEHIRPEGKEFPP